MIRKTYRLAAAVAVVASLATGATGCKNDCQNSAQSNPGNNINSRCDK